jgi:DNA mismatch repair protein MLH1
MLCNEYFYQVGLTDFANYGTIRFNPPLSLHDLLTIAAEHEAQEAASNADGIDWANVVTTVHDLLVSKGPLLKEYFSIEISPEGALHTLPLLMKNYTPPLSKLPQFLLRLGPYVTWDEEKACFQTLLRELASFYVPERLPLPPSARGGKGGREESGDGDDGAGEAAVTAVQETPEMAARRKKLLRAIEYTIFPACKARLVATKGLLQGVMEVANLKGLYRVFERC